MGFFFFNSDRKSQKLYSSSSVHSVPCNYMGLDFVLMAKVYYFILLDCFPLFLHFLTSLIKFVLWSSGETEEAKAFLQTRGGGQGAVSPRKAPQGPAQFEKHILKVGDP